MTTDDRGSTRHPTFAPLTIQQASTLLTVPVAGPSAPVRTTDLFPPLPDGEPALPISEFVRRAAFDAGGSLEGREVALTGFLLPRGGTVQLARLSISCCAADARANRVRLVGADRELDELAALEPETWLRVRGTLQPGSGTDDPQ